MSEFKFACPVCGQHMACDSSRSGTVMECPTCFQKITAPQAPASDDTKFIITGTKKGERPVSTIPGSSSSFVPTAKGFPGMVVVVLILIFIGAVVTYVYHGAKFSIPFLGPTYGRGTSQADLVTNESNQSSAKKQKSPNPTFAAPAGSVNLALHRPTFASSQENGRPPSNGNDGDVQTRWCASSAAIPQWWTVDFGAAAAITNTQIIWERASAYKYLIETSQNNSDWTVVMDKSANAVSAQFASDDFSARARYVRVVVSGLQTGSWASFYEFRAFGSISGNDK